MTLRVNLSGTKGYTSHRKALPATIEDDEKCMNYECDESRKKSKSSITLDGKDATC